METATFQTVKLAIVSATSLSKDALHVHVGLGIFLLVCLLWRRPLDSPWAMLAALAAALLGEAIDMRHDLASFGHWRWKASVHDIVNTAFWPFVLFGLARWTPLFGRRR